MSCTNNCLTSLPNLPNCNWLECNHNKIKNLPFMMNCVDLDCSFNNLYNISLKQLDVCQKISFNDNPILLHSKKFQIFERHYFMDPII